MIAHTEKNKTMMQAAATNFGLSGLPEGRPDNPYDAFLGLGKKGRRRRKERRARRKERREIRFERRRLKNDDRRADTEAKRTQTALMKATMLGTPAPASPPVAPVQTGAAPTSGNAVLAAPVAQPPGEPQRAGLDNNTLLIVVGVLVVGGFLFMNQRKPAPAAA